MIRHFMGRKENRQSLRRRNESKSGDWYVIDDGTEDTFIVHRGEIKKCIERLMEMIRDHARKALQDVLDGRDYRDLLVFSRVLVEAFNDRPRYSDDDLWITVYRVEQSAIDAFNDYVIDCGEDERVIPENPTERQIRQALFCRPLKDLIDFLREKHCDEASYYIPDECLKDSTIRGMTQEISEGGFAY